MFVHKKSLFLVTDCLLGLFAYFLFTTITNLVEKVEKRARKPWITREMMGKIDERRK
jgi:hypothetical protein